MNVLVMNLTRLGDLLQSQPAIAGLAAQGHRISLACLENFAPAAALMQGLDAVLPFPGARILSRLDVDWRQALAAHQEALAAARGAHPPEVVINLTPSEPARLLAMSLKPGEVRGFALDEYGFNADSSSWAAFLLLASTTRGASPFNIVDLFRRIAGLSGAPGGDNDNSGGSSGNGGFGLRGPSAREKSAALARIHALCPQAATSRGLVALQLGASEERRRWPVAYFAQLATRLAAEGYTPVLLGTQSEQPLGERLKPLAPVPLADLMGATDLPGLAATLAGCALLVTNDTGTMHLAAGLGVPSVSIFLATAQPWDTGPYLPGCLCLEPDLAASTSDCHPCAFGQLCPHRQNGSEACRWAIRPEGVATLALAMLTGALPESGVLPNTGAQLPCPGARVWRTVIGADGLMDLESLSGHEDQDRTRLIRLQRRLYRRYLDGEELEQANDAPVGLCAPVAQALGKTLGEAADLLFLLSRQGELLARGPAQAAKGKFLATWQRVRGVLGAEDRLAVLSALWLFESERPGLDLAGIMALTARFRQLLLALRNQL